MTTEQSTLSLPTTASCAAAWSNPSSGRQHLMPFGPQFNPDSRKVEFRIWAPSAKEMALALGTRDTGDLKPMRAEERGWFKLEAEAKPGQTYQFVVDGTLAVPDPASRFQPSDVHGPSEILDPASFNWSDQSWKGRPWEEVVLYELNVGTFTEEGSFSGVQKKLRELADLGVTAIELMPLADFPGRWGWGYDGVLPFAPDSSYGRPEDLKALIQAAHHEGLMVFLDVVYNHFGPDGNYLYVYAKNFFTEKHHTPWGAGINYDDKDSDIVRSFFIQNALYWLNEYRFDGLRLDAVQEIKDDSSKHFLFELAEAVAIGPGSERHIHLVVENNQNQSSLLRSVGRDGGKGVEIEARGETEAEAAAVSSSSSSSSQSLSERFYSAQWNDDIHHALHVLTTAETGGYYADYYASTSGFSPIQHLGRCLTQGFTYQGQLSKRREKSRGQRSGHLPPTAFVSFIQNHDQVGNRAFGERLSSLASLEAVRAIAAVYLLAPSMPMLFMGEEWGSTTPYFYFCDVGPDLGPLVTEGRRNEFARFAEFSEPGVRERIPDPCSEDTFLRSKVDWQERKSPLGREFSEYYRRLLGIRAKEIVPLLRDWTAKAKYYASDAAMLFAQWARVDGKELHVLANLSAETICTKHGIDARAEKQMRRVRLCGRPIFMTGESSLEDLDSEQMKPWTVIWMRT